MMFVLVFSLFVFSPVLSSAADIASSPLTLHSCLLNTPTTDNTTTTDNSTQDWLEIGRYSIRRDPLSSHGLTLQMETPTTGTNWMEHKQRLLRDMTSLSSSPSLLSFKLSTDVSSSWHLQTSVPLAHLSPTSSSSHGILSLHLTTDGSPFAISHQRHSSSSQADTTTTTSTHLFNDDEFVLHLPSNAPEVLVMPRQPVPSPDAPKPPPSPLSLIQRYWWVIVVVLLATTMMGTDSPPAATAAQPQQARGR
eukprot:GHVS01081853.1.p1 GENE.GHVS01081853.1~~GHVS01081853.1.p1  ORF type:complete len:250 (-),score=77.21 GHVS01081853.1:484-1233(-)